MFSKSIVVAAILGAVALSTQAAETNEQLSDRITNLGILLQDTDIRAQRAEFKADSNTTKINDNKAAIASNAKAIKQQYAEMTNNFASVNSRIDNMDEEMKKGFASQAALNGLFQPYNVGKFNLSVAVGGYESEQAMALGTGYRFNESFAMKAGLASDVGGFDHVTYNVGANFEW